MSYDDQAVFVGGLIVVAVLVGMIAPVIRGLMRDPRFTLQSLLFATTIVTCMCGFVAMLRWAFR